MDAVVLVDVSGEMDRDGHFDRARELLLDLVDRVAVPGAQVAVIPFGKDGHDAHVVRVGQGDRDVAEARARLRSVLTELRAVDAERRLHAALERGVQQLRAFAAAGADRERRLVVVSTGSDTVEGKGLAPLSTRLMAVGSAALAPGRGWTVWYGHFGEGDAALLEFLAQRHAGVALDLEGVKAMRWTPVRVETAYVSIGELPAGEWRRQVRLFVEGVPGVRLAVRGDAGTGVGSTLVATAPRAELKRARSTLAVDLSGTARAGAHYSGAHVRVEALGPGPVWMTGSRVAVEAGGDLARVSVDATAVAFDRVDRGATDTRELLLVPNARAERRAAQVEFEVLDVPTDVDVTVEPRTVKLDARKAVRVVVAPRGGAVPGEYESRVVLKVQDGVRLDTREVRVRYLVGHGSVRIEEASLPFGDVVRGADAVGRLTLVPDQGAIETGAKIEASVEGFGEGVEVEVQPRFTLFGPTALEVHVRVSSLCAEGVVEGAIRFVGSGEVRVLPDRVPVTISVVPPPDVALTKLVEIGDVRQTQLGGFEFAFPVEVDPAHHGTVLEFVPKSAGTQIVPSQVRLREGVGELQLKLVTEQRAEGSQSADFTVFSLRDGARREEGGIRFAWNVLPSFVRIVEWRQPPPLARRTSVVEGTLVLDASPDLRGRTVEVKGRFEDTGTRTRVTAALGSFEILGGPQSVPMKFDVIAPEAGAHPGLLEFTLENPEHVTAALSPVAVRVEIPERPALFALLSVESLLSPQNRDKVLAVGGAVLALLVCLLWLLRRNRRVVHRMVRFTPPPHPRDMRSIKEVAESLAFEDELRR